MSELNPTGRTRVAGRVMIPIVDGPLSAFRSLGSTTLQSSATVRDTVVETYSVPGRIYEPQLAPFVPGATFVANNPSVATIDGVGKTTYVAPGAASFTITGVNLTRRLQVNFQPSETTTERRPVSWVSGSLARHLHDGMAARIVGKTGADRGLFSAANHDTATYTRNTGAFYHGALAALTGLSIWNSMGGTQRGATLITARHVLCAAHFPLLPGTVVRWVTAGNVAVERTVIGTATADGFDFVNYHPDYQVCTLDAAVPGTIAPVKLPPADLREKLPDDPITNLAWGPPLLVKKASGTLNIASFLGTGTNNGEWLAAFNPRGPIAAAMSAFWEEPVGGDSGQPVLALVNGEAVLLTVLTAAYLGTDLSQHRAGITAAIAAADAAAGVSTGLNYSTADLSGFPSYT